MDLGLVVVGGSGHVLNSHLLGDLILSLAASFGILPHDVFHIFGFLSLSGFHLRSWTAGVPLRPPPVLQARAQGSACSSA